jgi:RHS repeat-associated protein
MSGARLVAYLNLSGLKADWNVNFRRILVLLATVAPAMTLVLPAGAQNTDFINQQGIPTFTTALPTPLGFLNLVNGNMHLEIPLASYLQRGKRGLIGRITFDSRVWTVNPTAINGGPQWQPTGGWAFTTGDEAGNVSYNYFSTVPICTVHAVHYQTTKWNSFLWTEPNRTSHNFRISLSQNNGCPNNNISSGSAYATDPSGFYMNVVNYGQTITVTAKDGTQVYPSVRDTNGNYFSPDGNGNVIDTLQRTPFLLSFNNPPNCLPSCQTIYIYLNSQGTRSTATLNFETVQSSSSCLSSPGVSSWSSTAQQLQSIVLSNGTSYSFTYDGPCNELTGITLPTGGQITYGYSTFTYASSYPNRWVTSMTVNGNTWSMTPGTLPCNPGLCQHAVTVTTPLHDDRVYVFSADGISPPWLSQEQDFRGSSVSGGTLQLTRTSDVNSVASGCPGGASSCGLKIRDTVIWPVPGGTLQSKKEYNYDNGNTANITSLKEWNFYSNGAFPTAADRETDTTYVTSTNYAGLNITNLPSTVQTKNASGTVQAQTNYNYDQTSLAATTAPQHASMSAYRGNQTTISRFLNTNSSYLSTTLAYDDAGNVVASTDPKQNTTSYSYTDNWSGSGCVAATTFAYLTKTTDALSHALKETYFPCTGLLQASQDQNDLNAGRAGTTYTYDVLGRVTSVSYPDGGQITDCYTDLGGSTCAQSGPPLQVVTTRLATPSPSVTSTTVYDGLGRVQQTQLSDPSGKDYTDATYDPLGRVASVSNPHRSTSNPTDGLTSYAYDALNRTTSATAQDGSITTTSYSGNCTTVTDPAGKSRESCSDGLGRLIQVVEDPGASPHLNYETDHTYDTLDNLLTVNQKGGTTNSALWRTRTFAYDSLARLTSAMSPESGTITYSYDANGNLLTRIAPLPNQTGSATITTTYSYDALNRLTLKSYSDGATPTPHYYYDLSNPWGSPYGGSYVGRLSEEDVFDVSGHYVASHIYVYDPMGRVQETGQCTAVNCNVPGLPGLHTLYSHDLLGNLTSYGTVENGITFGYRYDSAGRPSAVTNSFVDAQHPATLASVDSTVGYYPTGALRKMTYGNGLTQAMSIESRLQPCRINLNSSGASIADGCADGLVSGTIQDFDYVYGSWGTTNSGNVTTMAAGGAQNFSRTYTYDSLNRIATMSAPGDSCSGLSWTIDPWGNRTDQTVTGGSCDTFHQTVNTQNRFVGPPYLYDAAGNMIYDGTHSYTYDGENRLTKVDSGSTATYAYDAEGNRVQKTVAPAITVYVFNPAGQVIHETDANLTFNVHYIYLGRQLLAQMKNSTTYFVHQDHLGTTRLVTGINQSVVQNLDYFPYGELNSSNSGITTHEFTGKERDSESGLDNFGARYNSSNLGRFMSPDPDNAGASLDAPQSWNAYSYVLNNPLKYVDPYGLDCIYLNDDGSFKRLDGGPGGGNPDCGTNADGTPDNGYYVDGTVDQSSISFTGGDANRMLFTFTNPNNASYLIGTYCVGDCSGPDTTVGVTSPLPLLMATTMSPIPRGLMPTKLSQQQTTQKGGFDIWNMTPQQKADVRACIVTGGEYGGETLEPPDARQAIAQVHGSNGKPAQYPGNNKPIIPNVKSAKRTPSVTGPVGFLEFLAGGQRCVQDVATK